MELATASGDLAGFVSRIGGIEPIIRGAAYARCRAMDLSFAAQVSVSSPLFNLPVEVIQRGRDHGEHDKLSYPSGVETGGEEKEVGISCSS